MIILAKYLEEKMKRYSLGKDRLLQLVVILILLCTGIASAQVGRTGVPFLLIAPGARAAGMGEAFISIADDATSVHWNPAGLGRYPLTGTWKVFEGSDKDDIKDIVLVKNSLPENNYRQYDIWGLVNNRLSKWDGIRWMTGSKQELKAGSSLKSLVIRYTGLSEDSAAPYIDKLARETNSVTPEEIDSLKVRLTSALPEKYSYKEEMNLGFEKINKAWLELRLNPDGFAQIRSDIYAALKDSVPSTEKLDKLAFGFNRAISTKGDRSIWIPYDIILPDTINCLGSDEDNVYVGTNAGLFRLEPDKLKWTSFTSRTDSTMVSDNITAIDKAGRRTMYIGTEKGLMSFTGRNFNSFPSDDKAPRGKITAIGADGDRNVWAAAGNELYHYDGIKWQNAVEKQLAVGQTLIKSIQSFYGDFGTVDSDKIMAEISSANSKLGDSTNAGQTIYLPYRPGYRGDITALGVDQRGRVWIGTTTGINFFDGERFYQFGYKLYTADKPTTVNEVATSFIPDHNSAKIEKLSALIKDYNELTSDTLAAGSKVLVYANALGSRISTVEPLSSKTTVVATDQGVVEYDNGKWGRMHGSDFQESHVSNIYAHSGEMWVGAGNKVDVYASPKRQITFMHSNYLVALASDIYYEYFSFVMPTHDWGTFGLGVTFLSLGNQERTNEIGTAIGGFYTYEMALTLSYGTRLMNNVYGGISLRYINSHLSDAGAGREKGSGIGSSVAVDGGVIYEMTRRLTLATTITNIGPNISYIDADQADPLPRKLAIGFNYKLVDSPYNRLAVVGEATKLLVDLNHGFKTEFEEIIPHLGLEYWYSNYVALRGGYVYDKVGVQKYFTLGASLQYSSYRFDFAYIPPSDENTNRLGNTLRFSMNVGF
jgi:hypothetical protein